MSHFVEIAKGSVTDLTHREIVSQAFAIAVRNIDCSEWKKEARENEAFTRKVLDAIGPTDEVRSIFERLRARRNDLNHAGSGTNNLSVTGAARFYRELEQLIIDATSMAGAVSNTRVPGEDASPQQPRSIDL